MSVPLYRRHAAARPLRVPPGPSNRAPIGPDALRAAYGAHLNTHGGIPGICCLTCLHYTTALTDTDKDRS